MSKEILCHEKLDRQFAFLKQLFLNLPFAEKDKKKWYEARRTEKIFALIALHNPGLRENLPKNSKNFSRELTLPVSRESQSFETLLGNFETYLQQNKKGTFEMFLTIGKGAKKSGDASTMDLFSLASEASQKSELVEEDLVTVKNFEKELTTKDCFSGKLWTSFLAFKFLVNKSSARKQSTLFADFALCAGDKNLINFPLFVLESFNTTKILKEKTFIGRRAPVTVFEEITQEVFFDTATILIERTTKELLQFYRNLIDYEQLSPEQKIRINYLTDKGFALPKIYENGFSMSNESVRTLCIYGGLRKEDMSKEGAILLAEILESENIMVKSTEPNMEWVVNVSDNAPTKWSKYNNLNYLFDSVMPVRSSEENNSELISTSINNLPQEIYEQKNTLTN